MQWYDSLLVCETMPVKRVIGHRLQLNIQQSDDITCRNVFDKVKWLSESVQKIGCVISKPCTSKIPNYRQIVIGFISCCIFKLLLNIQSKLLISHRLQINSTSHWSVKFTFIYKQRETSLIRICFAN